MPKQFECRETARKMIVAAAGRRLREKGFDGVGVDALMREADLTSGAFYTQFASKKDLLLEVINSGLEELKGRINEWQQDYGDDWLAQGFADYFSQDHRQSSVAGCVLPSLAIEAARDAGGCAAKKLFEQRLTEIADALTTAISAPNNTAPNNGAAHIETAKTSAAKANAAETNNETEAARQRAWTTLALMTGGMILARAVATNETADEILAACRQAVDKSLSETGCGESKV